jgi:hypothetical protein
VLRSLAAAIAVFCVFAAARASAQVDFEWSATLPFTGGEGLTHGDLVAHDDGVTALHSRPAASALPLWFSRWTADGVLVTQHEPALPTGIYYEPSLCWDGVRYAAAASSYTSAAFFTLDAAGDPILAPTPLPSIPFGGRTAAPRVRCTPLGYAVFALLLEPTYEGSPYFYTRLHYWLVAAAGHASIDRDLGILLAPISYPGFEGLEKEYYDVAWTGAGFLVAYAAECGAPASFQACYRVLDAAGDTTRAEAPLTTLPTQGPHLATDGAVVAAASLRQNAFPGGNTLYARFFAADGTPLGAEQQYDDPGLFPTGYAPQMVRAGPRFLAAYVYPDPFTLAYRVMLAPFTLAGARLGYGAAVGDPLGLVEDTVSLGVDFQLAAQGTLLYGKGQAGVIQIAPIVFRIPEPAAAACAAAIALAACGWARRRIPRRGA